MDLEAARLRDLTADLPKSTRGYDCGATDALLGRLVARQAEIERECTRLRDHAASLEAELARYRRHDRVLSATLHSAMNRAVAIREEARHEAELALRKARVEEARSTAAAKRIEGEKAAAERELVRLGKLTEEIQTDLSGFLTKALEQLRGETGGGTAEGSTTHGVRETLVEALGAAVPQDGDDAEPVDRRPVSPRTSG